MNINEENTELINKFLVFLEIENGFSKNTVESYKIDISQLFLELIKDKKSFSDINKQYLIKFLELLDKKDVGNSTICRKISCFRTFFSFLQIENIVKENPASRLILPKKKQKIPRFLSEEEVFTLLDFTHKDQSEFGIRIACMLEILYASGIRVSELVSLPISTIGKTNINDQLKLKDYIIIRGKGNKERMVPLNNKSLEILEKYLDLRDKMGQSHSKWLFTGIIRASKKNKITIREKCPKDNHITRQRFHQMLKELALKTNINPDRVSPHIIRHSFASHLLNNGVDLVILQELLGHADISTTQIYTHVINSKLEEAINKHPLNLDEKYC